MIINPGKCKAIQFTRAVLKIHWITLFVTKTSERICCKYLGTIIQSDLNWLDQINDIARKAWKAVQ
jgi:hypothetical protein